MLGAAAAATFTPPLKNIIFTVGVKSVSKMSFLRSMGSTKSHASYGAWEAHFRVLQHLGSQTTACVFGIISTEGCQKLQNVILALHEKQQKRMLLMEHGKQTFHFCDPS